MKRACVAVAAVLALAAVARGQTVPASAAGDWSGAIETPGQLLGVVVHLAAVEEGWTGTIDVPVQGLKGRALRGVTVEGSAVKFVIDGIPGDPTFDGVLAGDELAGAFTQGAANLKFKLVRGTAGLPKAVVHPQEPKRPFPYREVPVSVPAGDHVLSGTLTLPPGDGPFTAAVMVTGSGPQNRDEELMGHRPFLVISDRLTRAGIAVLRCDDRGVGKSTGNFAMATTADFAEDALACVGFLRGRPEIRKDAVGVIGHSEGGLVGPMAAAKSADVAYVVMLAGPGVNGADVLVRQTVDIARAGGAPEAALEKVRDGMARAVKAAAVGDREGLRAAARELAALDAAGKPVPDAVVDAQVAAMEGPWFRFFLTYDPKATLGKVRVPVLAINGGTDLQVAADVNVPAVEAALKAGGNTDVTATVLPGLNHLFQKSATGNPAEYGNLEETFSDDAIKLVADWINHRFPPAAAKP